MSAPFGEVEDGPSNSKVTAIHAALHHSGKVLIFHCRSYPMWTRLYDPVENEMSETNLDVPIWPEATQSRPIEPSRIFCAGHCFMPDGRLLVAGGERDFPYPFYYLPPNQQPDRGLDYCFIFDPSNSPEWIVPLTAGVPHQMMDGRWYPSLTVLNDGRILAMGGKADSLNQWYEIQINRIPEFYAPQIGWTRVSNSSTADMPGDLSYFYPAGNLVPFGVHAGKVFFSTTALIPVLNPTPPPEFNYNGPGYAQIFNPTPTGSEAYWQSVGDLRESPSEDSNHILLPLRLGSYDAKILVIGGQWGPILPTVEMINLNDSTPLWTKIDQMSQARWRHNSIILPDRRILVVGGENENGPVLLPELFDTDTLTWLDLSVLPVPSIEIPRRYHSTALLLPNAKVFLGGGRVEDGGDVENDTERRITIFKPGYLMDGVQPVIINTRSEITYKQVFTVQMDGNYPLDSMALIKPMSVTHGYVSEQRFIELAFEPAHGSGLYNVTAPDNSNIAPPGYYMLFVMKDVTQSNSGESRIPSNAVFIKLNLS